MKKTKFKENLSRTINEIGNGSKIRGITLISLVITIIVIVILAGVIIIQLNDNGILKNAKIAKEKYANSQGDENATIDDYSNQIESYEIARNSRDTVTISKEEYDMLKNINNYSTSEKKIGTWIDGKPLYQKTLTGTTGNSGEQVLGIISNSLGNYCTLISFVTAKDGAPFNGIGRADSTFYWWIRKNGEFVAGSFQNSEMKEATFYATFQYTKSID